MITPYPPPLGPRVELLRVRRVDPALATERSGPPPLRDPVDTAPAAVAVDDQAIISAEAVALQQRDQQDPPPTRSNP